MASNMVLCSCALVVEGTVESCGVEGQRASGCEVRAFGQRKLGRQRMVRPEKKGGFQINEIGAKKMHLLLQTDSKPRLCFAQKIAWPVSYFNLSVFL